MPDGILQNVFEEVGKTTGYIPSWRKFATCATQNSKTKVRLVTILVALHSFLHYYINSKLLNNDMAQVANLRQLGQ